MKKIFLTMLGAVLMAAPAYAQTGGAVQKVDANKLRAAVAKSNAEIANAKSAAKAATWVKRGETLLDVDAKPVNGVYASMPESMLRVAFGNATPVEETVGGTTYTAYPFENMKAYVLNGTVEFFIATTVIEPGALDKAYDAFAKAYEMDAKTAAKVKEGLGAVRRKSFENGGNYYTMEDYKTASENFRRAYKASAHPAVGQIDTLSLYYAGMTAAYGSDYATSLEDIDKALAMGYESDGDVYRIKFLDLYSLERKEESLEVLKAGIAKYPSNENLIDMIMRYYAENDGDPSSIIPLVESAIAKNPSNPTLYQGLARVYDKFGQIDQAIATVKKSVELAPDEFLSNYLEGYYIIKKGDEMNVDLGKQNFTSSAQYQSALAVVNSEFRLALAPLEKAFEIDPKEVATVELLKNLTFRLREEAGMQAKYDKYNELFNTMNVQ